MDVGGRNVDEVAPGWLVECVSETGSTNADLLASASARPNRSVLVADHQTQGRGRLDRRWEAPPGANLLVSLLFHDVPADAGELVRRASLAVVDAVRTLAPGADVKLKWPNDVLLSGRKLAGVLAQQGRDGAVVVGLGVNVGWCPDGAARLGAVDRARLLTTLLRSFDQLPDDPDALMVRYRTELATLGERVRVDRAAGDPLVGEAVDIDQSGRLIVRSDDGRPYTLAVADVTHLRSG